MPKSIVMYPSIDALVGGDLLYLAREAGGADRDRKLTIETLRQHCTAQGVRLLEVTLGAPGSPTTVDVSGTTNVVMIVRGLFPAATDDRLNVTGEVPEGCYVVVLNKHLGLIDLSIDGTALAATPEDLDFGPTGRAELVSRDGTFVATIVNDSRWTKARLAEETTRAEEAEQALTASVEAEAQARADAVVAVELQVVQEEIRATAAEEALEGSVTAVAGRATALEAWKAQTLQYGANWLPPEAGILATASGRITVISTDVEPGVYSVSGWVNVGNPGNGQAGSLEVYAVELQVGDAVAIQHPIRNQAVGTMVDTLSLPERPLLVPNAGEGDPVAIRIVLEAGAFYNGGTRPVSAFLSYRKLG